MHEEDETEALMMGFPFSFQATLCFDGKATVVAAATFVTVCRRRAAQRRRCRRTTPTTVACRTDCATDDAPPPLNEVATDAAVPHVGVCAAAANTYDEVVAPGLFYSVPLSK